MDILKCVFWEEDVEDIVQIPVGYHGSVDICRWFFTKSGYYSVKSAYYVAHGNKKLKTAYSAPSTSSHQQQKEWAFIWKLQVPNKIRVF